MASVTVGWPNIGLMGVLTRLSLFGVAEGQQFANSPIKFGLNTTSYYASPPSSVLFLIAIYVWDLEEFCFFLHVVASPER